jgi:N-acetylmuramoyl-L-alanine amidase
LRRERGITEISFLKALASILAAVLVAGLLAAMAFAPGTAAQDFGCRGDIVLDPGHGGSDTGAVNKAYNLKESEEVLKVANILKGLLVEDGYAVCMTRTTNAETLSNNDRYTYAISTGARILVSIHMNGSTNPATDYTTTLFGKWQGQRACLRGVRRSLDPARGERHGDHRHENGLLVRLRSAPQEQHASYDRRGRFHYQRQGSGSPLRQHRNTPAADSGSAENGDQRLPFHPLQQSYVPCKPDSSGT